MGFFPLLKSPAIAMYDHGNKSRRSAELALEHVNAREDVLRDYNLEMVVCDSGVSTFTDHGILSGSNWVVDVFGVRYVYAMCIWLFEIVRK